MDKEENFAAGRQTRSRQIAYSYQGSVKREAFSTLHQRLLEPRRFIQVVAGLAKYVGEKVRQRASSPKLQVLNNALMTAPSAYSLFQAQQDRNYWGRLVESAIGAHLLNQSRGKSIEVFYWRDRNYEVDFVLSAGRTVVPIEVKSGRAPEAHPGTEAFAKRYAVKRKILVGGGGVPIEEFLLAPVEQWMEA